jgi:hypothetical protein
MARAAPTIPGPGPVLVVIVVRGPDVEEACREVGGGVECSSSSSFRAPTVPGGGG